jgi:hypothetical protein
MKPRFNNGGSKVIESLIAGIGSVLAVTSVFVFVIRGQNLKLSGKQDKALCDAFHAKIEKELNRGDNKFDDMLHRHEEAIREMGSVNTQLSLVTQKLEIYNPIIEEAAKRVFKSGKPGGNGG